MNKYKREIAKARAIGKTFRRKDYGAFKFREWWGYDFCWWANTQQEDYDLHTRKITRDGYESHICYPNWWAREGQVYPDRRNDKAACRKLLRLLDVEDAPLMSNGRRIKRGYWN